MNDKISVPIVIASFIATKIPFIIFCIIIFNLKIALWLKWGILFLALTVC